MARALYGQALLQTKFGLTNVDSQIGMISSTRFLKRYSDSQNAEYALWVAITRIII